MSNSVNHSILWQRGSKLPPCCMKKCFWFLLFSNSWWFDASLFTASHDTKNFHSLFDLSLLLMILESSLLWLLFAKLILVFVILWNCYNLVFYFFYFLFLRNSYIIFSDLWSLHYMLYNGLPTRECPWVYSKQGCKEFLQLTGMTFSLLCAPFISWQSTTTFFDRCLACYRKVLATSFWWLSMSFWTCDLFY